MKNNLSSKENIQKLKILFFIESLRSGGKERRLVELAKELYSRKNIDFKIVLMDKKIHYKDILSLNCEIFYLERRKKKIPPHLFLQFFNIARKYSPDIIHVWGSMAALYAIPAKLILNIKMINSQITDALIKSKREIMFYRITFFFSDQIISNSLAGLKAYNLPSKGILIHNGFNFDRIEKLEDCGSIRNNLSISSKFIVGMVATFSQAKDYRTYIKAALQILDQRDDVTFLCIGAGDISSIKDLFPFQYKNKIRFLAPLNNIEAIMNICNIGVLSTFLEGVPNAIMEFMALGKPVIVTEGGGSNELVEHNKDGFLTPVGNYEKIRKNIIHLLDNPKQAKAMGMFGKNKIKNEFNIIKMENSFYKCYKEICAG